MAFERQAARAPVAIADISIQLFDPAPGSSERASAAFSIQVRYDDGGTRVLEGNLAPHLTAGEISALQNFMVTLRARAVAQILPEGTA